jgi:hypothetical protein
MPIGFLASSSKNPSHSALARLQLGFYCAWFACGLSSAAFAQSETLPQRLDFVVSEFAYALAEDYDLNGACPEGLTRSLIEIHQMTAEGVQLASETDADYVTRMRQAARDLGTSADGRDLCMHPEAADVDPHYRTVKGSTVPVSGIDLDDEVSDDDFVSFDGRTGVDNQWYRVVGCNRSFHSSGASNGFDIGMLTGSWGILIALDGVDDRRDDSDVTVYLYSNGDPIALSAQRLPLAYASYAPRSEPHYRAVTRGQLVAGVLTTDPVDISFQHETNSMYTDRVLLRARLEAVLNASGELSGYLGGYTPIEAHYDMGFAFRNGRTVDGELAPLRLRSGSANGAARVLGHTCHGAYQALQANADAFPDPETGANTAISVQYHFTAIPAFIVSDAGGQ